MSAPAAWSLLTVSGYRHYGGNTGYADNPSAVYRYDSNVSNYRRVAEGDIVVLRTRSDVIGFSRIEKIVSKDGEKERQRCPDCNSSDIKLRRTMRPKWWCRKGHLFDEPNIDVVKVRLFEAWYGANFIPASGIITVEELKKAVLRPVDQMSIQEIDIAAIEPYIRELPSGTALIKGHAARMTDTPGLPKELICEPSIIQEKRNVLREISIRQGDAAFRRRIIDRYGYRCLISGCPIGGLLDAAHISPYSLTGDNSATNGLILRTDIHALFDLGLLAINPETLKVHLAPNIQMSEYRVFSEKKLATPPDREPSRDALAERWEIFEEIINK